MVAPHPQPTNPVPAGRSAEEIAEQNAQARRIKLIIGAVVIGVILIVAVVAAGVIWLGRPDTPPDLVGRIRDIFIIVMALESLLVGMAVVVLLIQLATLINLLQNEVRPIIKSTSEAVNTMRGTAQFLGESVVEPVIKLNTYLASIQRVLELMGIKRR